MKKIRRGNDFVFAWAIERNGLPEDLSSVLEKHLYLSALGKRVELVEGVDYDITGNVVRIEVTPTIATILGTYKAEFHYILPDLGFVDEDRKCAVDVNAFVIVGSTEQADNPSEFSITSDMAIAFKGDKGDSSYQTWLDAGNTGTEADYLAWIQQPATDIEQVVSSNETVRISSEETRQLNETARIEAETLRGSAETQRISDENTRKSNETGRINAETLRLSAEEERGTAEGLRASSETSRNTAEGQRATAETARATAEGLRAAAETARVNNESARQSAEELRQTNTAEAIQSANTAAQQADTARTELTTAVNTKLGEADGKISEMNTTLSTYDGRVSQAESDIDQLAGDVSLLRDDATVKMENIVINGDFRNGTTGWTSLQSTLAVVDGKMVMTYLRNDGSLEKTKALNNSKHYIRIKYSNTNTPSNSARLLYMPSVTPFLFGTQISDDYSVITIPPLGTTSFRFLFYQPIGGKTTIERIFIVDLEQIFGAGNEPTKEEFELLLSTLGIDYFEGEITIPAQKIMQWQLKLIRKNKNAIIALGGTII